MCLYLPLFSEDLWHKWFTFVRRIRTIVFITAQHIFQRSDVTPLWFVGPLKVSHFDTRHAELGSVEPVWVVSMPKSADTGPRVYIITRVD